MPRVHSAETLAWKAAVPGLDTSPMELVVALKRAGALFERALETLYDAAFLTPAEADILITLRHRTEPMIARALADHLRVTKAAVGQTLAKLERRGLIERQPSPVDRRAMLLVVTGEGCRVIDALFPRQLAIEVDLLAGLGECRQQVLDSLQLLGSVMASYLDQRGNR